MRPTDSTADRNLLFGIVALQNDLLDRDALAAALRRWATDRTRSLEEILRADGTLDDEECRLVEQLVARHLDKHAGDPVQTLARFSTLGFLRDEASLLDDEELATSIHRTVRRLGGTVVSQHGTNLSSQGANVSSHGAMPAPLPSGGAVHAASRFRILRKHARGGLGEVYVAEDTELHREVALKEIQIRYADDAGCRQRFVLEAEVTGGLEHPGIVPVYGLGAYVDGRPYYAMRFIRGESLRKAIERHHSHGDDAPKTAREQTLSLRKLLGRFVAVCDAMHYAHSRGVLHRDIKPENIMLGPYGETLVVDWGLAKLIAQRDEPAAMSNATDRREEESALRPVSAAATHPTQLGATVGTPVFMSPEQALGWNDALTPASDVYSLGATLYVLLTGKLPFASGELGHVLAAVQNGSFPRPREAKTDVPRALEAICLKAMSRTAADRYQTPRHLADDLEAYLADEPVSAWREPLRVRAGRWVRRHRTLVYSTAMAALVLLVSLSVGIVLLAAAKERETVARHTAETERDRADGNFEMARDAVKNYLTRVADDPRLRAHGLELLRRDLLEIARPFYVKLVAQKADNDELRSEQGWAYFQLGSIESEVGASSDSARFYEQALRTFTPLARRHPSAAEHDEATAMALNNLSTEYQRVGRFAEAEQTLARATSLFEGLVRRDGDNPTFRRHLANCYNNRADRLVDAEQLPEAEAAMLQALGVRRELADKDKLNPTARSELASAHSNLAVIQQKRRRFAEADASIRAAIALNAQLVKEQPDDPWYAAELATNHKNLADLLSELGRYDDAAGAYEESLLVRRRLAARHPEVIDYQRQIADSQHNLGSFYSRQAKWEPADAAYQEAVRIRVRVAELFSENVEDQLRLAQSLSSYAQVCTLTDKLDAAQQLLAYALPIRQRLADEHAEVADYAAGLATTHHALGDVHQRAGRLDEAEQAFQSALDVLRPLVDRHADVVRFRFYLGMLLHDRGVLLRMRNRDDDAQASYLEALDIRRQIVAQHGDVPDYRAALGATLVNLGRIESERLNHAAALARYQEAIEALEPVGGGVPTHEVPAHGDSRSVLLTAHYEAGRTQMQLGRHALALAAFNRAAELDQGELGPRLRMQRAFALARSGEHAAAAAEARAMREPARGVGPALYDLARTYGFCLTAVAADEKLSAADRMRLVEEYAAAALGLLEETKAAGYFAEPANVDELRADAAFQAISSRAEFRMLLDGLKSGM